MKVAIVYDRANKWGGAERVLLVLKEIFPTAALFTSVYNPHTAQWAQHFTSVNTSFLQHLPLAKTKHELLAPLMPLAFESIDLTEYDLVISVTSEAAKGVICSPRALHICYCLTPTRYLWSHHSTYFPNPALRLIAKPAIAYLRKWDKNAAHRPDVVVGISKSIQARLLKYYDIHSKVIYPPVSMPRASSRTRVSPKRPYYLLVSRLVPYKNISLAINAFNKLGKRLIIIGTGSQESYLRSIARPNIIFTGMLTDGELNQYYENTTALVFPQEEDFGLVAVEAQLFGKPVVAYSQGGALETVINRITGIYFHKQNTESLTEAIKETERTKFNDKKIKMNAEKFSKQNFIESFKQLINQLQSNT